MAMRRSKRPLSPTELNVTTLNMDRLTRTSEIDTWQPNIIRTTSKVTPPSSRDVSTLGRLRTLRLTIGLLDPIRLTPMWLNRRASLGLDPPLRDRMQGRNWMMGWRQICSRVIGVPKCPVRCQDLRVPQGTWHPAWWIIAGFNQIQDFENCPDKSEHGETSNFEYFTILTD